MTEEPILSVRGLERRYGSFIGCTDIDFDLWPGEVLAIVGESGSGKTTLLNRMLRDPALADTVVIVNEFGEIGLDHLLIERIDEDMVLLGAGCLCCTVRGDLIATLEDLLRKRDNGRIKPFRRVVIETTGQFGYTVRVLPDGDGLATSAELGLVASA